MSLHPAFAQGLSGTAGNMKVDLSSLPKQWKSIQWDSDESTITAYYIAAPTSTSSTSGAASVDALFTSDGGYLIKNVGTETFDPPVGSHTKSSISISPDADITIPFTLIDSEEETVTGALRFAPFKVEYRWKFDPPLQFADGKSVIRFSVTIINPPDDLEIEDYDIKQDKAWKLNITRGENLIEGTITSDQPSKGKLSLTSKGTVVNTSKDEVGFARVDISIANLGSTTPLAEDRQPGGESSASTPHETDPGAYLITTTASPSESSNTASSSTGPRAQITLSGNGGSFTEGSYELTTSGSDYILFYETAEGGQPIELPKTYSATELASPKKLYAAAKPIPANTPTQTATVKLTYKLPLETNTQPAKLEDEVKVRILPVEVTEVWSDQITGVEANGYPDKTGWNEYPYILIGATSGSTFKVKIKLASEIPVAFQSKILFRWAPMSNSTSPESGTSTFTDTKAVQLVSNAVMGVGPRGLVMGFDENSTGQLEAKEMTWFLKTPHIKRGTSTIVQYQFIPISQTRYNDSKSLLLGWASNAEAVGTLANGARHLTAFCNGTVPAYAGSEPTTIARKEKGLSHPVGIAFTPPSIPGSSFKVLITKDHKLSQDLIESKAMRNWLIAELNAIGDQVRQNIVEARQNGGPEQVLHYAVSPEKKSIGFDLIDPDLLLCLGKVSLLEPLIEFDVTMYGIVHDVKINGYAEDLYDFDHEGEELLGYPARKASELQAGFPSLGSGGKVFKTKIDLGGGNPLLDLEPTPYSFYPN